MLRSQLIKDHVQTKQQRYAVVRTVLSANARFPGRVKTDNNSIQQ